MILYVYKMFYGKGMRLTRCFFLFLGVVWSLDVCADDSSIEATINQQKASPEYQHYCLNNPSQRHPYYKFVEWWSLERACHPEKDKDGRITQALLERAVGFGGWSKTSVAKPDEVTVYKNGAFLHYWGSQDDSSPQDAPSLVKALLQEQWQIAQQKRCLLVGDAWLPFLRKASPVSSWLADLMGGRVGLDNCLVNDLINQKYGYKENNESFPSFLSSLLLQEASITVPVRTVDSSLLQSLQGLEADRQKLFRSVMQTPKLRNLKSLFHPAPYLFGSAKPEALHQMGLWLSRTKKSPHQLIERLSNCVASLRKQSTSSTRFSTECAVQVALLGDFLTQLGDDEGNSTQDDIMDYVDLVNFAQSFFTDLIRMYGAYNMIDRNCSYISISKNDIYVPYDYFCDAILFGERNNIWAKLPEGFPCSIVWNVLPNRSQIRVTENRMVGKKKKEPLSSEDVLLPTEYDPAFIQAWEKLENIMDTFGDLTIPQEMHRLVNKFLGFSQERGVAVVDSGYIMGDFYEEGDVVPNFLFAKLSQQRRYKNLINRGIHEAEQAFGISHEDTMNAFLLFKEQKLNGAEMRLRLLFEWPNGKKTSFCKEYYDLSINEEEAKILEFMAQEAKHRSKSMEDICQFPLAECVMPLEDTHQIITNVERSIPNSLMVYLGQDEDGFDVLSEFHPLEKEYVERSMYNFSADSIQKRSYNIGRAIDFLISKGIVPKERKLFEVLSSSLHLGIG